MGQTHVEERCKHGKLIRQCRCPRPDGFKPTIVDCPKTCEEGLLWSAGTDPCTDVVKRYLDEMIEFWRKELMETRFEDLICRCYIDAYQSARSSLLGEVLPPSPEFALWLETHPQQT